MRFEAFEIVAVSTPEGVKGGHQRADDYPVRRNIYAAFDHTKGLVGLKLTPEQQGLLMAITGAAFPANGSWGAKGWTKATLADASAAEIREGVKMTWANVAPETLSKRYIEG